MSRRKRYSPKFKREAIELVRRSGTSYRQVALEIGVAPNLLTRWVERHNRLSRHGSPRGEKLTRLKRELAECPRSVIF